MLRALAIACCAAALVLAGCGSDDEEPAAPSAALADLTVTLDRDGEGGAAPTETRVECADAADSAVCGTVADFEPAHFEPVPRETACTQQYGGPQTATVQGTLRGEPIDARFSRTNGCEISRWRAVEPLLEASG